MCNTGSSLNKILFITSVALAMSQQLQINPLQWTITFSWNPKIRWAFALCLCLTYSVSAQQTGGGERKPGNERWDDVERTSTTHFRLHSDCTGQKEGGSDVCDLCWDALHCALLRTGILWSSGLGCWRHCTKSCTLVQLYFRHLNFIYLFNAQERAMLLLWIKLNNNED